ncbi:MAG: tRNA (adenine(22)-N(1))-methyltransferase TrmK [Candidatus Pelagadaptatus aseana]|uniref:tRNA (adenine(22)-N(1))-methyltransferase TrmK n=1 Tax=Candidatus Pelagadaptatus aseana TaxID=3120508 RepID=UPI0039B1D6CC
MLKPPTLGPRLSALLTDIIELQTVNNYDVIWDCCCDHGYLGLNLRYQEIARQLVFVDLIPTLIEQVEQRIEKYEATGCLAITADVGKLEFNPEQKHLVIIAGIGGENIAVILEAIRQKRGFSNMDFIFCPTTTQYHLRSYLAKNGFISVTEKLVTESNRDYEIIGTRQDINGPPISPTGTFWDPQQPAHRRYLTKLIRHYNNQNREDPSNEKRLIAEAYSRQLDE